MNVREHKTTCYWGSQRGKLSLNPCAHVSFRVSMRAKRENISLDVIKWVVQFGTCPKICVATFFTEFRVDANYYITS